MHEVVKIPSNTNVLADSPSTEPERVKPIHQSTVSFVHLAESVVVWNYPCTVYVINYRKYGDENTGETARRLCVRVSEHLEGKSNSCLADPTGSHVGGKITVSNMNWNPQLLHLQRRFSPRKAHKLFGFKPKPENLKRGVLHHNHWALSISCIVWHLTQDVTNDRMPILLPSPTRSVVVKDISRSVDIWRGETPSFAEVIHLWSRTRIEVWLRRCLFQFSDGSNWLF